MKKNSPIYAEVAPNIPLPSTGRQSYTYKIPKNISLKLHQPVNIPLGSRTVSGVVVKLHSKKLTYRTKTLSLSPADGLTPGQIMLTEWISKTMLGGLGYSMRLANAPSSMPPESKLKTKKYNPNFNIDKSTSRLIAEFDSNNISEAGLILSDIATRIRQTANIAHHFSQKGLQVLWLMPEKWLAAYATKILSLNENHDWATLTSDNSKKQLNVTWHKVKKNISPVIIGTQKSIYLPFKKLGLIILDEEFYSTHKLWDQFPRLDNYYAANQLASIYQAKLLYASSFPSLRLHQLANKVALKTFTTKPILLDSEIMSFSFEDFTAKHAVPQELVIRLRKWINKGDKILFLQNKLGQWQYAICRNCKHVVRCSKCQSTLTVHSKAPRYQDKTNKLKMVCPQCANKSSSSLVCPSCHKKSVSVSRIGVDGIADKLNHVLATKPLVIQAGSSIDKSSSELLNALRHKKLVVATSAIFSIAGTVVSKQPLIKDSVSNVGLFDRVIWLFPEQDLLYPDFRSIEKAMYTQARLKQLLVSNRKKVLLVSRQAEMIRKNLGKNYSKVYATQLTHRQRLSYPPATDLVRLTIKGKSQAIADKKMDLAHQELLKKIKKLNTTEKQSIKVRGPFKAFHSFNRGLFEAHISLSGKLSSLTKLYSDLKIDVVDLSPERIL